jgi:lipoprotein-releasing system permease protein
MKTLFWLALRFIFKNKKKHISFISILSCLGIGLGVCSLIVVLSVMSGFDSHLRERLLGFNFHLTAYTESRQADLSKIRHIDQVQDTVIFSQVYTAITGKGLIYPIVLQGTEFTSQEEERWQNYLVKGDFQGLALGRVLALELNLNIGDTIQIFNPKTIKPVEFRISGIFDFGIYDLDSRFAISSYSYLEDFFNQSDSDILVGLRIDNIYNADLVKQQIISEDIPNIWLLRTWSELNKNLFSALKLEKIAMFIILSLIILVASFNIFTTQTVNVVEKIKDIGILKTLGLSKVKVGFLFCIQGVFVGIGGILLGGLSGIGICLFLERYHFIQLPAQIYSIDYLPVLINYREVFAVCGIGLLMVIIFSLLPGLKAAGIQETEALRYE